MANLKSIWARVVTYVLTGHAKVGFWGRTGILTAAILLAAVPLRETMGYSFLESIWPSGKPATTSDLPTDGSHLPDFQNRVGTGEISDAAEKRAEASALYAQGVCFTAQRDPELAAQQLKQASDIDGMYPDLQVHLANLYLQIGKSDNALEELEAAAKRNPDSAEIGASLSYCLRLHGHISDADSLGYEVLRKDPSQSSALRVILENSFDGGALATGLDRVTTLFQSLGDKVHADDWISLARVYDELARSDSNTLDSGTILRNLAGIYQQAASVKPESGEALRLLAETYRDLNQPQDYLKYLQKCKGLDPSNTELLVRCASLEEDQNQRDLAMTDYETAYRLDSAMPGLEDSLAQICLETDHFSQAAGLLESLVAQDSNNLLSRVNLGIAYEGMNQTQKAKGCFDCVFNMPCPTAEPFLKLASFQISMNRLADASHTLDVARQRFPSSAYVSFLQAVEMRHEKRYSRALSYFAEARDLATRSRMDMMNEDYFLEVATTEALAGDRGKAEELLIDAHQRFPESPAVMNQLAYFYGLENRHLDAALSLAERAAELRPQDGEILDTLGWIYFQENKPNEALPYLQQASELTNNNAEVCLHLGKVLTLLNRPREAIQAWSRGLSTDPDNSELKSQLSKILTKHATHFSSRNL